MSIISVFEIFVDFLPNLAESLETIRAVGLGAFRTHFITHVFTWPELIQSTLRLQTISVKTSPTPFPALTGHTMRDSPFASYYDSARSIWQEGQVGNLQRSSPPHLYLSDKIVSVNRGIAWRELGRAPPALTFFTKSLLTTVSR